VSRRIGSLDISLPTATRKSRRFDVAKREIICSPVPTEREIQILSAVTLHGTIRAAARALGLSRHTIDAHLDQLRERSGYHYLPQLVAWATTYGWIEVQLPGQGPLLSAAQSCSSSQQPSASSDRDVKKIQRRLLRLRKTAVGQAHR
jgi:DNA-binding CsgD family transcriptional regulator